MDNSFFSKFTPKEPKFFPLLESLAEVSHKSAEQLITCVKDNKPEILQRIRDLEHEGDRVIEKVYYELNDTFITPFDREDINSLANGIDDVTDQIYGCAKRITFYKPKQIPRAAEEIAQMVLEGTQYMHKAIGELHSLKKKAGEIARDREPSRRSVSEFHHRTVRKLYRCNRDNQAQRDCQRTRRHHRRDRPYR